ncbi:unnamed protein product [Merluccius merluccius]
MASLADVGWKLLEFRARSKRAGSIYEPLKLSFLQREDEPLWEKLDHYYKSVKATILNYQSPTTGLFPVKTCSSCKEAKVRDSLYCAAGSWALAMAYRRIDDDMGRTHELEHSAIKCMRGILYCYMRQADKVEQFKQDPSPSKCLHSVFNVDTGDEMFSYSEYSHLQIDAVSLFLLYLVEMIGSGLQIIYNTDEVSFIQNLVFCVERAYRMPDYGMWERGSKYNNGGTELHSRCRDFISYERRQQNSLRMNGNKSMNLQGLTAFGNGRLYAFQIKRLKPKEERLQTDINHLSSDGEKEKGDFIGGFFFHQSLLPEDLLCAYRFLAINKKLGLSGRPERPVGCIGTCKIYRILGKTVVCYPIVFDLSDFYLSQDVMLLIDDIKNTLQFIKQCWKMQGRPLFLVLIREDNIKGSRFNPVLDMLASFKKGNIGGVKVHVDRLQTLISGAVVEQLDFLRVNEAEIPEFKSFEELELPKHSKVKRQSSTPNASDLEQQAEIDEADWRDRPSHEILAKFHDCDCLASQAQLAAILLRRPGPHVLANGENLMDALERIYRRAGSRKLWSVVRLAASLLSKLVDSLAPSITSVLVHGKQVTLGLFGQQEEVISNPLSPEVIKAIIYSKCSPHGGEREAVLQQELVIHIGWILSNSPQLFSGMLKIRIGWIVQAMKHELQIRAGDMPSQDIYQLSPSDVKQLLLDVLQPQPQLTSRSSWLNRRQIDGSLNRTPLGFYDRIWQVLERTPNGILVAGTHLPQQPTLSDMTMYEMNFSLLVEDTLKSLILPEYRQIIVELLMVVSIVLERNPELEFAEKVDLDRLVKEAFADFQRDRSHLEGKDKQDSMEAFYNTQPTGRGGTAGYLSKAVIIQLLQGDLKPCKDDPCSVS